MALRNCKECGNKISTKAVTCPQCGAAQKKNKGCFYVIWIIIFFIVIYLMVNKDTTELTNRISSTETRSGIVPNQAPEKAGNYESLRSMSSTSATTIDSNNQTDNDRAIIRTAAAYVIADRLNDRLSPNPSGKITNVLDRGHKVYVLEVEDGWARISRYYDGSTEGVSGGVARWVSTEHLSHSRPVDDIAHTGSSADSDSQIYNDRAVIRTGAAFVTADRLSVRLSPNPYGKITNVLDRGHKVDVLEVENGWARISRYYDGFIEGVSGRVARWVSTEHLSHSRPVDDTVPASSFASPLDRALRNSDDFRKYRPRFLAASEQLISQQRCTIADFKEYGWARSTTRGESVYFTFCGDAHIDSRIYLDVLR